PCLLPSHLSRTTTFLTNGRFTPYSSLKLSPSDPNPLTVLIVIGSQAHLAKSAVSPLHLTPRLPLFSGNVSLVGSVLHHVFKMTYMPKCYKTALMVPSSFLRLIIPTRSINY